MTLYALVCLHWQSKLVYHALLFHMDCLSPSVLPFHLTVRFFHLFQLEFTYFFGSLISDRCVIFQSQMERLWSSLFYLLVTLGLHTQSWSFCWTMCKDAVSCVVLNSFFVLPTLQIVAWCLSLFFFFISFMLCSLSESQFQGLFLFFLFYFLNNFSLPTPTYSHLTIDPF